MVWTCPWYEGEGGWAVNEGGVVGGGEYWEGEGRKGPGKCATDYYEKSSLKKLWDQHLYTPYGLQH